MLEKQMTIQFLTVGIILIPFIFFFAYKGFGLLMKSIFDKK